MNWTNLTSTNQLEEILSEINGKTIGIFKHSTRCGISKMILNRFESDFPKDTNIDMYYLDLLNYREISNEIANKLEIVHQSPQLILVKDGHTLIHASHNDILTIDLINYS